MRGVREPEQLPSGSFRGWTWDTSNQRKGPTRTFSATDHAHPYNAAKSWMLREQAVLDGVGPAGQTLTEVEVPPQHDTYTTVGDRARFQLGTDQDSWVECGLVTNAKTGDRQVEVRGVMPLVLWCRTANEIRVEVGRHDCGPERENVGLPDAVNQSPVPGRTTRKYVALPDAVEQLRVSERTVRRLVADGQLAAMRWGRRLRFDQSELDDFIARRRAAANRTRATRARAVRKGSG